MTTDKLSADRASAHTIHQACVIRRTCAGRGGQHRAAQSPILRQGLAVGVIAALAAGCASSGPVSAPYAAGHYTGAEGLYARDEIAPLRAPVQYDNAGRPLVFAKLEGIAGARQAHQLYGEAVAEELDGDCEGYVPAASGETLLDIAELCDVPLSTLVDYNPNIDNPYLIRAGQLIEVPGISGARGLSAIAGDLADIYTLRPGDTLARVAYRFDVAANAVIAMNPGVNWNTIEPGERVRLPAQRIAGAPGDNRVQPNGVYGYNNPADPQWKGYAGYGDYAAHAQHHHDVVTRTMPYNREPLNTAVTDGGQALVRPRLEVSTGTVRAGRTVEIRWRDLEPGTRVTFARGRTADDMTVTGSVEVGADRVARKRYGAYGSPSEAGGWVYRATRDDTGETLFSERVGVITLRTAEPDAIYIAPAPSDMNLDEELERERQLEIARELAGAN